MAEPLLLNKLDVTEQEIVSLLAGYQMLPHLKREIIIDKAIEPFTCTPEEKTQAYQQFYAQNQMATEAQRQTWLGFHGMTIGQLENLAVRGLRIEKFKQATWGNKIESYYLSRKSQLDKVIYSLIRVKDINLARELYFRIQEGEQSFAEVAKAYSQGPEARTNGLIGPVELSSAHPILGEILSSSQPNRVHPPLAIAEWAVIVRLEQWMPSELDEAMRQQLLNELFITWLQEQLNQFSLSTPSDSKTLTAVS